jgi:hypothetical protein
MKIKIQLALYYYYFLFPIQNKKKHTFYNSIVLIITMTTRISNVVLKDVVKK